MALNKLNKFGEFTRNVKKPVCKFLRPVRNFFIEFCDNCSVHGIRYITERTLHWSERLWWIIAIGLSVWACVSFIKNTWTEWQENPTIINIIDKTDISAIPFPTVVICPETKTVKDKFDLDSKFDGQHKLLTNLTQLDVSRIHALSKVCHILSQKFPSNEKYSNDSIYDIIESLAPKIDDVLNECRWKGKLFKCSERFSPVFIREGFCFAFNALNSHEFYTDEMTSKVKITKSNSKLKNWSWDAGYAKASNKHEYPIRTFESGRNAALEFLLTAHKEETIYCKDYRGFTMILKTPGENMEFYNNYFQVPLSQNAQIPIEPQLIVTSNALRSYNPNHRKCFYNTERRLRFFKVYTKRNCEMECLASFIEMKCGCVQSEMPRAIGTQICGLQNYKCYLNSFTKYKNSKIYYAKCNCLDACQSIEYDAKMDKMKFNMTAINKAIGLFVNYTGKELSKVAIYFKDSKIPTVRRTETNNYLDFLATCGGLLGLFLGISTLGIIEIVYFFTLRLFWNICRSRSNESDQTEFNDNPSNELISTTTDSNTRANLLNQLMRAAQRNFQEFCDNGCIHGIRYFTERRLHRIERWYWIVAVIVSIGLSCSMIRDIWVQWEENPVTMIESEGVDHYMIPYPTVTICLETKILRHKLDLLSALKNVSALSATEKSRLDVMAHICPLLPDQIHFEDNFMNESIYNIIQDVSPDFKDSVPFCAISGFYDKRCREFIVPILTEEGLCFTINALNSHDIYTDEMAPGMMTVKQNPNASYWNINTGYGVSMQAEYPMRITHPLLTNPGFAFQIDQKNIEYQCKGIDQGIKLILTTPGDSLKISRNSYRMPLLKQSTIIFQIKLIKTSESLRRYPPNKRQCFYDSERRLRFFKYYSQNNCEAECLANFTKAACGCVKFSMPRDRATRICGGVKIDCYKLAEKRFSTSNNNMFVGNKCNCLPSCRSIEYTAKFVRRDMNQKMYHQFNDQYRSKLLVLLDFITKVDAHTVTRVDTYTWTNFLADCGGFIGLFLGISALSGVELIYYTTLRLFWKFRQSNHKIIIVLPAKETTDEPSTSADEDKN